MMESTQLRRTIRRYQSQEVEDSLLNELLLVSSRVSTMGNMQLYSVVVTRDAANKEKLAPAHFNQPMVRQAPVVLTVCADFNRFSQWCSQREATPGYDNFLSFLNAATDALLFAEKFCTLAEEKGLGICYLGTTLYNAPQIIEILKLPQLVFPVTTLTLGWPDEDPSQVDRLPLESFLHQEQYKDYTPVVLDTLYAHKESLPENRQFIAENQKKTLAQVFTEVRYKKADNESISVTLLDTLKKQGFLSD